MADNKYRLPDDSANTGVFLDLSTRTVGGVTVCEERHVIVDNVANNYLGIAADGSILSSIWDGSNILGTSLHPVRTDPTGSTVQPVNGTVTANQGTSPWAVADSQVIADNAAFTDGTSKLFISGFVFDEVAGTTLTENDAAAARVDSKRAQVFVIEDETTRGQRATVTAGKALKVDNSAVTQPVQIAGSGTVLSNQQAVTASAVALATNTCKSITVKALAGNGINVYVGPTGVTTATGFELAPGDSVSLPVTNTNLVFVIAAATGASVSWIATN